MYTHPWALQPPPPPHALSRTTSPIELPAAIVGQTLVPLPHGFMAFSGV